jgi:hypothetical protein
MVQGVNIQRREGDGRVICLLDGTPERCILFYWQIEVIEKYNDCLSIDLEWTR